MFALFISDNLSFRKSQLRSAMLTVVLLAVMLSPAHAADDPAQTLRSLGLTLSRDFWINEHEVELRDLLAQLDRLERSCFEAQKQLDTIVDRNNLLQQQLKQAEDKLKAMQQPSARAPAGTQLRKSQDDAIKQQQETVDRLKDQFLAADKLAESPAARGAAEQLNAARDAAWIAVSRIHKLSRNLKRSYRRLSDDPRVGEALAAAGAAKLGPASSYDPELQRVARFEAALARPHVPLYRESGVYRISALVNGHVPATLTFDPAEGPTIITSSLAELAGISVAFGTASGQHHAPDGRALPVQRAKIHTLRIGSATIMDVSVLVLPPEGEDLGSRISAASLTGFEAVLHPQQLRLELRQKPTKPADAGSPPAGEATPAATE